MAFRPVTKQKTRWSKFYLRRASVVAVAVLAVAAPTVAAQIDARAKTRIAQTFAQTPLYFEVNDGQFDRRVSYAARGPGYGIFLTPSETVFSLRKGGANSKRHAVRLRLIGGRQPSAIRGEQPLASRSTYFIGNDRSKWRGNIAHYGRVRYEGVYSGIDVVYYGNQRRLEYDFIVAPGADPGQIELAFAGVDKVSLDANGNLIFDVAGAQLM